VLIHPLKSYTQRASILRSRFQHIAPRHYPTKDGGVLKLIDLGAAAMCLGDNPLNYYAAGHPSTSRAPPYL